MKASYILAAGKQSRFKSETPKGLMPWKDGKTVLDINIENSLMFTDKVVIVTSYENFDIYNDYVNTHYAGDLRIEVVKNKDNFGSGSTIYQALALDYERVFIMWADSVQEDIGLFKVCVESMTDTMVIPCRYEENPYTLIETDDELRVLRCRFKKFKEIENESGYHDLSLFYGNPIYINFMLHVLSFSNDLKESHGNEMEFLDIANISEDIYVIPYETKDVYSFNTVEEFNKISNH